MAREIFISYSRKDISLVKSIISDIEHEIGIDCWQDINEILSDEQDYLNRIAEGIEKCKVFLFMLSKSSQESEHAVGELVAALKQQHNGVHVAVVNIDNCEMNTKFTVRFATLNIISWMNTSQRDRLMSDLRQWLGKPVSMSFRKNGIHLHPIKCRKKKIGIEYGPELFGFANDSGDVVIPCRWKRTWPFSVQETLFGGIAYRARVQDERGLYGFIDETGRVAIPIKFKYAEDFPNKLAGLAKVYDFIGKDWLIDIYGNLIGQDNNGNAIHKLPYTY